MTIGRVYARVDFKVQNVTQWQLRAMLGLMARVEPGRAACTAGTHRIFRIRGLSVVPLQPWTTRLWLGCLMTRSNSPQRTAI
jgi:hypothetical protein